MGNFLTSWGPVCFLRRTLLHGVSLGRTLENGTVKIIGLPSTRGRQKVKTSGKDYESADCTVVLRLSGLIGTASHPDMQNIRKIRFFFEK